MPDEVTIMPEPKGDEPPYAQKAIIEIREQQLAKCQEMKSVAIDVIGDVLRWTQSVARGEETVMERDMKGELYAVDGKKYIFENSAKLKDMIVGVEKIEGKEAADKNVLHVAILGRSNKAPVKSAEADVISVEIVEE